MDTSLGDQRGGAAYLILAVTFCPDFACAWEPAAGSGQAGALPKTPPGFVSLPSQGLSSLPFVSLSLSAVQGCAGRAATSSISYLHYLHGNNNKTNVLFNIRINFFKCC